MGHAQNLTRSAFTAVSALSLLALAACGGGSAKAGTDAGAGAGAEKPTLRYAYAFTPVAALSPYSDDAVTSYGVGATETLTKLDPSGTPEASLATSWEQTDDTTWELTLRDGVTFQDGTAMDAKAVAASLTHAAQAEPAPRALSGTELTVTADGDDKITVVTKTPDPVLVQRLTSPELVILSGGAYDDPASPTPVGTGTGPYTITELNGTTSADLTANPAYWGGTPALKDIELSFVADGDQRASALRAGQTDLAQAVPADQLPRVGADHVLAVPLPRTVSIHLTQTSKVFQDASQREAAREAVAGLDIAGSIYAGAADPAKGLFSSVSTWAADRPAPEYPKPSTPAKTRITLATFSDRPELAEIATVVADEWRKAGFDVKTVVQEYNQMEGDYLKGTYDAVIMSRSYGQDTADPISYLQADFGCDGGYNISRYCDTTLDTDLAEAATQTDVSTRNQAAVAAEHTVLSDVAVIPLIHDRTQFGLADGVTGLAGDPWERAVITAETTISN
ncbi:ABC transporter substrate-binding protein [Kineosporia succinea]|uniref:Peptide/nickel transport system substrate-binding protein n=1 Tax=Kineosporia succinea TaxID=84632 RepID=A0ABT9P919_9ACTN|nr:ABC transporter substrate-binding protein [Kineosporia succinea]MDP9829196.1 peptide/nickel transport system substrate-binding protein [Kineosporia succinea]